MKGKLLILMFVVPWLLIGCQRVETPQGTQYRIDVNSPEYRAIEKGAEAAEGVLWALSSIWPVLGIAASAVGSVAVTLRKMKPKLDDLQQKKDLYYDSTKEIVLAIERFKAENPEEWEKLEEKLIGMIGEETDAVIRALRGLPPRR